MKKRYVKRRIHYYELEFGFFEEYLPVEGDSFISFINEVISLSKTRADIRYQSHGEKTVFLQHVKLNTKEKLITGLLRSLRMDVFPEIYNTETEIAKGVEAAEEEGLLETAHFVINYDRKKPVLAIEYNQYGAKIGDFAGYLQRIGNYKKTLQVLGFRPVVNDNLAAIKERIRRCSEFTARVHKDNIPAIEKIDIGLFSMFKSALEHFDSEFATITLKYNYRQRRTTEQVNNSIFRIIDAFKRDKNNIDLFNELSLKAEDEEKNKLLETFDLLVDKVKSDLTVERKQKHKTVVTVDIFEKMKKELYTKKLW